MAVAHDEATMELIKNRLANSERPLIRLLRTFYRLSTLNGDDPDELRMCHATFLLELQSLIRSLSESKGIKTLEMTRLELDRLSGERDRLENEAAKERERIMQLESELEDARRERRNKIQYEEIGKEVRRFSDRLQSAERIDGLAREIEGLLEEQGFYAERWASRRAQFDTVISNLEVLQECIREEKADADRKKALNDDESDIDNPQGSDNPRAEPSGEADAAGTPGKQSVGTLDPTAPPFLPGSSTSQSSSTKHSTSKVEPETEPSLRALENPLVPPSSGDPPLMDQMEIDQDNKSEKQKSTKREGLAAGDASMEDGEEVEEAEEGQEMEHE